MHFPLLPSDGRRRLRRLSARQRRGVHAACRAKSPSPVRMTRESATVFRDWWLDATRGAARAPLSPGPHEPISPAGILVHHRPHDRTNWEMTPLASNRQPADSAAAPSNTAASPPVPPIRTGRRAARPARPARRARAGQASLGGPPRRQCRDGAGRDRRPVDRAQHRCGGRRPSAADLDPHRAEVPLRVGRAQHREVRVIRSRRVAEMRAVTAAHRETPRPAASPRASPPGSSPGPATGGRGTSTARVPTRPALEPAAVTPVDRPPGKGAVPLAGARRAAGADAGDVDLVDVLEPVGRVRRQHAVMPGEKPRPRRRAARAPGPGRRREAVPSPRPQSSDVDTTSAPRSIARSARARCPSGRVSRTTSPAVRSSGRSSRPGPVRRTTPPRPRPGRRRCRRAPARPPVPTRGADAWRGPDSAEAHDDGPH